MTHYPQEHMTLSLMVPVIDNVPAGENVINVGGVDYAIAAGRYADIFAIIVAINAAFLAGGLAETMAYNAVTNRVTVTVPVGADFSANAGNRLWTHLTGFAAMLPIVVGPAAVVAPGPPRTVFLDYAYVVSKKIHDQLDMSRGTGASLTGVPECTVAVIPLAVPSADGVNFLPEIELLYRLYPLPGKALDIQDIDWRITDQEGRDLVIQDEFTIILRFSERHGGGLLR